MLKPDLTANAVVDSPNRPDILALPTGANSADSGRGITDGNVRNRPTDSLTTNDVRARHTFDEPLCFSNYNDNNGDEHGMNNNSSNADNKNSFYCEGFLEKQREWKFFSWESRFFVLCGNRLSYSIPTEDDPCGSHSNNQRKGPEKNCSTIVSIDCSENNPADTAKERKDAASSTCYYYFTVWLLESGARYHLRTSSKFAFETWTNVITRQLMRPLVWPRTLQNPNTNWQVEAVKEKANAVASLSHVKDYLLGACILRFSCKKKGMWRGRWKNRVIELYSGLSFLYYDLPNKGSDEGAEKEQKVSVVDVAASTTNHNNANDVDMDDDFQLMEVEKNVKKRYTISSIDISSYFDANDVSKNNVHNTIFIVCTNGDRFWIKIRDKKKCFEFYYIVQKTLNYYYKFEFQYVPNVHLFFSTLLDNNSGPNSNTKRNNADNGSALSSIAKWLFSGGNQGSNNGDESKSNSSASIVNNNKVPRQKDAMCSNVYNNMLRLLKTQFHASAVWNSQRYLNYVNHYTDPQPTSTSNTNNSKGKIPVVFSYGGCSVDCDEVLLRQRHSSPSSSRESNKNNNHEHKLHNALLYIPRPPFSASDSQFRSNNPNDKENMEEIRKHAQRNFSIEHNNIFSFYLQSNNHLLAYFTAHTTAEEEELERQSRDERVQPSESEVQHCSSEGSNKRTGFDLRKLSLQNTVVAVETHLEGEYKNKCKPPMLYGSTLTEIHTDLWNSSSPNNVNHSSSQNEVLLLLYGGWSSGTTGSCTTDLWTVEVERSLSDSPDAMNRNETKGTVDTLRWHKYSLPASSLPNRTFHDCLQLYPNSWSHAAAAAATESSLSAGRNSVDASNMPLLIVGGCSDQLTFSSECYALFLPSQIDNNDNHKTDFEARFLCHLPQKRAFHKLVTLKNGFVLCVGGQVVLEGDGTHTMNTNRGEEGDVDVEENDYRHNYQILSLSPSDLTRTLKNSSTVSHRDDSRNQKGNNSSCPWNTIEWIFNTFNADLSRCTADVTSEDVLIILAEMDPNSSSKNSSDPKWGKSYMSQTPSHCTNLRLFLMNFGISTNNMSTATVSSVDGDYTCAFTEGRFLTASWKEVVLQMGCIPEGIKGASLHAISGPRLKLFEHTSEDREGTKTMGEDHSTGNSLLQMQKQYNDHDVLEGTTLYLFGSNNNRSHLMNFGSNNSCGDHSRAMKKRIEDYCRGEFPEREINFPIRIRYSD